MISLLCPTRGRPERAMQFLNSVLATQKGNNEILFGLQEDDPRLLDYPEEITSRAVYFKPSTTVNYWNWLAERAMGDLLTLIADDVIIRTRHWDIQFDKVKKRYPDGIYVITTQDGRGKGIAPNNLPCPHPTISRVWYETLGYLTFPLLTHYYADTWNAKIAVGLGRMVNLYDVTFEHIKEKDATRKAMAGASESDRIVFEQYSNHRLIDQRLLKWEMNK